MNELKRCSTDANCWSVPSCFSLKKFFLLKVVIEVFGACDWIQFAMHMTRKKMPYTRRENIFEETVTWRNSSILESARSNRFWLKSQFDNRWILCRDVNFMCWARLGFCLFSHYFISSWNLSILFAWYRALVQRLCMCVYVCPNIWSSKFHQAIGAFAISCIKYIHFNRSRFDCMCTIWPSKLNADVGRMHELTINTDKTREKYNGESNYLNSSTFSKHMNSSAKKIKILGHFYLKLWK